MLLLLSGVQDCDCYYTTSAAAEAHLLLLPAALRPSLPFASPGLACLCVGYLGRVFN